MLLEKKEIKNIIPYQEPFLFVDGVEKIEGNEIYGFFQTSKEDYYFKGHFIDFKIMPGALIIESLAQLSTIYLRKKIKDDKRYHFLAYKINSTFFFRPIFPGDKIDLRAEILGIYDIDKNKKIANVKAKAFSNRELKAESRFSVIIIKKEEFEKKYLKDLL